jgi:hypothetical protein
MPSQSISPTSSVIDDTEAGLQVDDALIAIMACLDLAAYPVLRRLRSASASSVSGSVHRFAILNAFSAMIPLSGQDTLAAADVSVSHLSIAPEAQNFATLLRILELLFPLLCKEEANDDFLESIVSTGLSQLNDFSATYLAVGCLRLLQINFAHLLASGLSAIDLGRDSFSTFSQLSMFLSKVAKSSSGGIFLISLLAYFCLPS